MKERSFVLQADFCWSQSPTQLATFPNGYLVCLEGKSAGIFADLPPAFQDLPYYDYRGKLVTPGLVDLHIHAPQYGYRGLGMDMELLDWLNTKAFPEESKYADLDYAQKGYQLFVSDLKASPTTRAAIFGTLHCPATQVLMNLLEESGLSTYVGKVSMDRNSPDYLCEASATQSASDTVNWLEKVVDHYQNTKPILTPRFIPSCSDELMTKLGELQKTYQLPVQSHLSENRGEVAWVAELCPTAQFYGEAYAQFGLFGGDAPTIMAHCVLCSEAEQALMKAQGVWVAHCPASNTNLSSGVAPVRQYLDKGIRVGLGTDVAGGYSTSIFRAMSDAIQASKLRWRLQDQSLAPLTLPEAFWLGTVGGGSFFGQVGSFDVGYELDAIVIDDSRLTSPREMTIQERLERVVYLSESGDVVGKFVQGRVLF